MMTVPAEPSVLSQIFELFRILVAFKFTLLGHPPPPPMLNPKAGVRVARTSISYLTSMVGYGFEMVTFDELLFTGAE
jgi:hypothetical protein